MNLFWPNRQIWPKWAKMVISKIDHFTQNDQKTVKGTNEIGPLVKKDQFLISF